MVLRKSFYIRWSAGRSPRVHEVNPGRDPSYILGIKIYRDRSKRLIGLSQSAYIDKVLKRFSMQDSKRGYLPMSHAITLSKSQCPNTKDEREQMS